MNKLMTKHLGVVCLVRTAASINGRHSSISCSCSPGEKVNNCCMMAVLIVNIVSYNLM